MTDYTRNPFFNSPYLEQTGNNLIKAFNDDGHAAENRARTDYLKAQTTDLTGKTAGREATASAIQGQDFSGPIANQFWSQLAANSIRSGSDPSQVAAAVQFLRANSHASDSDIAAAVVGHMGGSGIVHGVSIGDRDAITKRAEDAAFGRTKYSADSSAGATIGAANIHEAGADRRNLFNDQHSIAYQFGDDNQPHMVTKSDMLKNPNNKPVLPNAYYEKGTDASNNPAFGLPGSGTVKPVIADHFKPTVDGNGNVVYGAVREGLPVAPKEEKPLTLTPQAAADMKFNVFQGIPGAMSADGKSVDPAFQQKFGEKIQAAETAAADTYKKTRDATAAEKAFKDALGIKPNQTFSPGTWPFTKPGLRGGDAAAPPEAAAGPPAGTAQAAPTIATQFAPSANAAPAQSNAPPPPPADPAKRVVGQAYPTPKGVMIWTAQGWVPQQAANDGAR